MRSRWAFVAAFIVAQLFVRGSATHAQVDESRKANWENAKRLEAMIVDAIKAGKAREGASLIQEFKVNIDIVQDKLERAGERLHDLDKTWLASTRRAEAIDKAKKVRITLGDLSVAIAKLDEDPASALGTFVSAWDDFVKAFDDLWRDYVQHGKELQERLKRFQDDCRECL